jgi:hypothetical protein
VSLQFSEGSPNRSTSLVSLTSETPGYEEIGSETENREVYPMLTWDEAAVKYNCEPPFQMEFDVAKKIVAGLVSPMFALGQVLSELRTGMSMAYNFACFTDAEFLAEFKHAPDGLEGVHCVPDLLQIESTSARGILMKHPSFPFRTLTLYAKNETALETVLLGKDKLARPKQAQEHFDKVVEDVRGQRHPCLKDFSLLKSIEEVRETVELDKARRQAIKDAEIARLKAWEERKARGRVRNLSGFNECFRPTSSFKCSHDLPARGVAGAQIGVRPGLELGLFHPQPPINAINSPYQSIVFVLASIVYRTYRSGEHFCTVWVAGFLDADIIMLFRGRHFIPQVVLSSQLGSSWL